MMHADLKVDLKRKKQSWAETRIIQYWKSSLCSVLVAPHNALMCSPGPGTPSMACTPLGWWACEADGMEDARGGRAGTCQS